MITSNSKDIIGREARGSDGEKIGRIIEVTDDSLVVEKGIFFPKDFFVPFSEVVRDEQGAVYLREAADYYKRGGAFSEPGVRGDRGERRESESLSGRMHDLKEKISGRGHAAGESTLGTQQQTRVPVVEEELEARAVPKQAGEVVIKKDVVTEQKQVSVPVTREEVHVERVPIDAPRAASASETSFQGGTIRVPITEEQVEINKRPVVKEEIRVDKTARREEQRAGAEIRKERVEIEGENVEAVRDQRLDSDLDRDEDTHLAGTSRDIDKDDLV